MHFASQPRSSRALVANDELACSLAADLAVRLADEAIVALEHVGITVAPVKGVMLLARWPALRGRRDLADVDLLVACEDFGRAMRALGTLGFEPTSHTNRGATLVRDDWPLSIDLHHRLFGPHLFDLSTRAVLGRAELDDALFAAPVLRVDDMDALAHVVGHAVKSRLRPDDPVVLDDVDWLLGALAFDARGLAAHLNALRLRRAAGYVLGASASRGYVGAGEVVEYLGLDARDHAAIRAAGAWPGAYWTPHLLNGSLSRGALSLSAQLRQDLGRRVRPSSSPFVTTTR
ncbi:MAG: nucleotidyltransferase family protein [Polyangiales bacterium]